MSRKQNYGIVEISIRGAIIKQIVLPYRSQTRSRMFTWNTIVPGVLELL